MNEEIQITPETMFNASTLQNYYTGDAPSGCCPEIGDYFPNCPNWYPQIIKEYYPAYYGTYVDNKSNIEKAFKIVQKLIDKKLVKVEKVKNFVELVNDIAEII